MVDPNFNATVPTNTVLHYLLPGLRTGSNCTRIGNLTFAPLISRSPPAAAYIGPQPPSPLPHSYTLLLFAQPANFTVPSAFAGFLPLGKGGLNRVNFPVIDFVKETAIGSPVAANYFKEGSANVTTTSPATRMTASASVVPCSCLNGSMGSVHHSNFTSKRSVLGVAMKLL